MPFNPELLPVRRHAIRALVALLPCWATGAWACVTSETGVALGSVTSQQVKGGSAITGNGAFAFTCGPVVLSALAGTPSIRATLQATMTGLLLRNGANTIPYQVYTSPGLGTAYSGGAVVINLNGTQVLNLLNGGTGAQVPLFIATTPGPNIPAGTYTDTLQLTWVYQNICEGLVNLAGLCLGVLNNGTVSRLLQVSLTVTNDCTITAPTVNFGTAPLVSGFPTVSQGISLLCTKGMSYTVGMSAGNYPQGGRRQMGNGTNRLAYDIFKADATVWGSTATARANGPAIADGATIHTIPYTASIYQNQPTPPAAVYTDNVVVDVSF